MSVRSAWTLLKLVQKDGVRKGCPLLILWLEQKKMTQTFGIINLAQGQYRRKPKNKKNIILTIAINSSNIFGKVMKNWLWNMV